MNRWHQNEVQKNTLLNLINLKGCVLEDAVVSLLESLSSSTTIHSHWVREFNLNQFRERIEIDAWFIINNKYIICEVKSSAFDWIFLRGPRTRQDFHLLEDNSQGLHVFAVEKSSHHPFDSEVTEYATEIAVHRTELKEEVITQAEKTIHKGQQLPLQPSGREIIHSSVYF